MKLIKLPHDLQNELAKARSAVYKAATEFKATLDLFLDGRIKGADIDKSREKLLDFAVEYAKVKQDVDQYIRTEKRVQERELEVEERPYIEPVEAEPGTTEELNDMVDKPTISQASPTRNK